MTLSISITGLFLFHVTFKPFINQGKFRTPEKRLSSLDKKPIRLRGSIFISVIKKQSGKLIRQPVYFPQRGKSTYSSARSPLRGTMPARLRMASLKT